MNKTNNYIKIRALWADTIQFGQKVYTLLRYPSMEHGTVSQITKS